MATSYSAFATSRPNYQVQTSPTLKASPTLTVNNSGSVSYSGTQIPATSYYLNRATQSSPATTPQSNPPQSFPNPSNQNTPDTATNPFSTSLSSYNNAANDYLKRMQELAGTQTANIGQQRTDTEARLNSDFDRVGGYYSSMIPQLQGRFDQFQTDANASLEAMRQATERSKASTQNQYLGAQRDALLAQRNNQAALDQKHAALGTVDSSFYGRDNANLAAEANRFRQMNNMEMADRLSAMDAEMATAERQAQQAIMQERANLEDAVRQINFQLGNNESARQQALAEVLANYNNSINSIQSNLAGLEYNLNQERWSFEQQLAEQGATGLSREFMATDIPHNEADYRFYIQNAGNYAKLGATGVSQDEISTAQNINRLVGSLLSVGSGLSSITGGFQGRLPNWMHTEAGQLALSQLQQIENLLTVKARQALKGQGQISDAETRMLAIAQSILGNRSISDREFASELMRIQEEARDILSGNTGYVSSGNSSLSPSQIQQYLQSIGA